MPEIKNTTAQVHKVETFGTVDGPGIRFILFLQGCQMRCHYCHNRDSWDRDAGETMSVEQIMAKLHNYRPYFTASGGGITVSGGEPLLQLPFLIELFKACKAQGIHTCLDTNGLMPQKQIESLKELLSYTDLVLLDIKQMNPDKHLHLTSLSNDRPLKFARLLHELNIPVWLRYVVVPGVTDEDEDIRALADFTRPMTNIEQLDLLPYHPMGEYKWEAFNDVSPLVGILPPTSERIAQIKQQLPDFKKSN